MGCEPTPWTSSAQWVPPGSTGLFDGTLRDPRAWVRGVPTIDVTSPSRQPYTGDHVERSDPSSDANAPALTPVELFSLMQALPVDSVLERQPEDATEPLKRWVEAHPTLTDREPAAHIIASVRWAVTHDRIRLAALPLAGTYQVTLDVAGDRLFSFFARTMAGPESGWGSDGQSLPESSLGRSDIVPPSPVGYFATAVVARTERALPTRRIDAERRHHRFTFRIGALPVSASGGTQEWAGSVLFAVGASRTLAADARSRERFADLEDETRYADSGGDLPAKFVANANGAVRVLQQHRLPDGRLLTIRATRVSRSVVRPR